jgi:hypothetical protein
MFDFGAAQLLKSLQIPNANKRKSRRALKIHPGKFNEFIEGRYILDLIIHPSTWTGR